MKEYSFLDIVFFVNGVPISGWGEGDDSFLMERINDSASHIIGIDGEMTVNLSAERAGMTTIKLMQTSASNLFLSGLMSAQENGVFVPTFMMMKDTRNNDLGSGSNGYITRPAGMPRGGKAQSQEWKIVVERLDLLHVGS